MAEATDHVLHFEHRGEGRVVVDEECTLLVRRVALATPVQAALGFAVVGNVPAVGELLVDSRGLPLAGVVHQPQGVLDVDIEGDDARARILRLHVVPDGGELAGRLGVAEVNA